jgi:hypothetical protein
MKPALSEGCWRARTAALPGSARIRSDPIRSDPIRSAPLRSDPLRSDPRRADVVDPGGLRVRRRGVRPGFGSATELRVCHSAPVLGSERQHIPEPSP